jgi:hypothetical protein
MEEKILLVKISAIYKKDKRVKVQINLSIREKEIEREFFQNS